MTDTPDTGPEAVERLMKHVTPGPWHVTIDDDGNPLSGRPSVQASAKLDCAIIHWDGFVQQFWRSARGDREIQANAAFIAAARELVPALSAENAALRAQLWDMQQERDRALGWRDHDKDRAEAAEAEVERLRNRLEWSEQAMHVMERSWSLADPKLWRDFGEKWVHSAGRYTLCEGISAVRGCLNQPTQFTAPAPRHTSR